MHDILKRYDVATVLFFTDKADPDAFRPVLLHNVRIFLVFLFH